MNELNLSHSPLKFPQPPCSDNFLAQIHIFKKHILFKTWWNVPNNKYAEMVYHEVLFHCKFGDWQYSECLLLCIALGWDGGSLYYWCCTESSSASPQSSEVRVGSPGCEKHTEKCLASATHEWCLVSISFLSIFPFIAIIWFLIKCMDPQALGFSFSTINSLMFLVVSFRFIEKNHAHSNNLIQNCVQIST